jgi:hypothetical protein
MNRQLLNRLREDARRATQAAAAFFGGRPTLRALAPLALPLILAPWLKHQLKKELANALFRDAVQSQYSGWCIRHGLKLYADVGAPDGPFIHFLHALMQVFVGITDEGCRHADLFVHVVGAGMMGALLAPASKTTTAGKVVRRLAWAFLAVSLWLPWYLSLGFEGTVQRDAYYALFGYLGMVAIHASEDHPGKVGWGFAFGGAALCTLMLFTRQSGIIYMGAGGLALLCGEDAARGKRIRAGAAGAVAAFALTILLVAIFGSLRGMMFWYFEFTFDYYRFWAKQDPTKLFTESYNAAALIAVVAFVGVCGAVFARAVPRRTIAFAFPPIMFLIAAALAAKGWRNHASQVTAETIPLELLMLQFIWAYRQDRVWTPIHAGSAALLLAFVAHRTMELVQENPFYAMAVPPKIDPDIVAAEVVGLYLKDHTLPADRIFLYGHEAHVLLYAERGPAVPYYVNILLNTGRLLRLQPPVIGQEPTPEELARAERLSAKIASDACTRLMTKPPAAMVFLDHSQGPFADGVGEVEQLCPPLRGLLTQYTEVHVGPPDYHVYLSNQNAAIRDRAH